MNAAADQDRRDQASHAMMRFAVLKADRMEREGKPAADIEAYMIAATVAAKEALSTEEVAS